MARRETAGQLLRFALIGATSTAAYAVLFAVLREWTAAGVANALALVVTAVANTAANRRFTFGVRTQANRARDHLAGLVAFGIALAVSSGSLAALAAAAPRAPESAEVAVLLCANAAGTMLRFALLRTVMLRVRPRARVRERATGTAGLAPSPGARPA